MFTVTPGPRLNACVWLSLRMPRRPSSAFGKASRLFQIQVSIGSARSPGTTETGDSMRAAAVPLNGGRK